MQDENQKLLFTNWLTDHAASVMKIARAYTLSGEESQDLAQEILLQAWRSLENFDHRSTVATWFYRVALHTAMNWHRKDRPRRVHQRSFLEIQHIVVDEGCDQAEQVQQREILERLYRAIHQLPKADAALVLLFLEDLSYREMADVLGVSENNIGVKLNRAKKTLSELMRGEDS